MNPGTDNPRARHLGLIVQDLPDEVLVYDLDSHKAHCLNRTAALVWQRCDGKATTAEIAAALGVKEEVVWLALDQLAHAKLMATAAVRSERIPRREMMRRLRTAAIAVPAVMSILVPTALAGTSCVLPGDPCTPTTNCCSTVCVITTCL